jgi:geranylgeranyl diphosphate synthase type I
MVAPEKSVSFAQAVRAEVGDKLEQFLAEQLELAGTIGPRRAVRVDGRALAPLQAAAALSTRGGKRLRAVLLAAAYEAAGGSGGSAQVAWAGVSLEVLQSYLLIHDDWMDGDATRRGGPSVHASLEETLGDRHLAGAAAVLAGDHFCALSLEALLRVPVADSAKLQAVRAFAELQDQVVRGQLVDVLTAETPSNVMTDEAIEAGYDLKTGSYTVRGPCRIGAALAGARPDQVQSLLDFAQPLGVAFQLRDDLLGTFGDPAATGKPAGNDLRRGNRTPLVTDPAIRQHPLFSRVFGNEDADDAEVQALMDHLRTRGVEARVEARIATLVAETHAALAKADLTATGKAHLAEIVHAMTARSL